VQDMSYMERLGLWGSGTYFKAFDTISAVLNGGGSAGAMEMLAVQLKSSGAYLARNLGLRGVDFNMETVKLAKEQVDLYDQCAKLWLNIHEELEQLAVRGRQAHPAVFTITVGVVVGVVVVLGDGRRRRAAQGQLLHIRQSELRRIQHVRHGLAPELPQQAPRDREDT